MSDDRRPSPGSMAAVVVLWLVGIPAIAFACGLAGLAAGFSADSGGDADPTGAVVVILVVGGLGLVGATALVLGGLGDDPPADPPAPYAGTPLSEVRPVSGGWPAKRHSGPDDHHPSPGDG